MHPHSIDSQRQWPTIRQVIAVGVLLAALSLGMGVYWSARAETDAGGQGGHAPAGAPVTSRNAADNTVELTEAQLQMIRIEAVSDHTFPVQREAVGSIDFNEDMTTQIYPPYQGRIVELYAKLGDNVVKGQKLFTIQSPDLIQADSALIAAAGVLELTSKALERAGELRTVQGIADKDYEQAISDQQTAEGALKAARDAVAVFGKSPGEIEHMVQTRSIDPYLVVSSPVGGRVTARSAAPGLFVQPGNAPAPYAVADLSRVWMNASVVESDMPLVRKGQEIRISVMAFPGRVFEGRISTLGATVDPQLHRGLVRAEVEDPKHELLPGMFAAFVIVTAPAVTAPAVPLDGVVREGNGALTVWVTRDRRHFTQRRIQTGLTDGGYDQVLEGVSRGEQIVSKGAMFLDNMINGGET